MLRELLKVLGIYKLYERWLWRQVKDGVKPEHVALILDGNRRWALKRSLEPWIGHRRGAEKVEEMLKWCDELGIKSVTLYVFSLENFRRSKREIEEIMKILEEKLSQLLNDKSIHERKARVKFVGRLGLLPERIQSLMKEIERATEGYEGCFLNVAVAYGGRAEIVDATKRIAESVKKGEIDLNEIDECLFERYLYTAHLPKQDPDFIIRTSGEERLSGFLLWQSAYSELVFLDVYWPEIRKIDFLRAVRTYQRRARRFGR